MHERTFAEDEQMLSVLNQGKIHACKAFAGSLRGFAAGYLKRSALGCKAAPCRYRPERPFLTGSRPPPCLNEAAN
jgi:folate-dependent tRNA-U54 methylase TrmFO/GidA